MNPLVLMAVAGCGLFSDPPGPPPQDERQLYERWGVALEEHGPLPGDPLVGQALEIGVVEVLRGRPSSHSSVFCYLNAKVLRPQSLAGPVWVELGCDWLSLPEYAWATPGGSACVRPRYAARQPAAPREVVLTRPDGLIPCSEVSR